MNLILIIFLLLLPQSATQTIIQGQIFDASTKLPLSYVNVGLMNTSIGTVSDVEGKFELRFNEQISNADIRFSMVGYQPISISIDELINQAMPVVINMEKIFYEMEELSASATRLREKRLGSQASSTRIVTGWGYRPTGGERGIRIKKGSKPIHIKRLYVHIATNELDYVLMRVNIREMNGDIPGESLLMDDILIPVELAEGWVEMDLEPWDLVYDQ